LKPISITQTQTSSPEVLVTKTDYSENERNPSDFAGSLSKIFCLRYLKKLATDFQDETKETTILENKPHEQVEIPKESDQESLLEKETQVIHAQNQSETHDTTIMRTEDEIIEEKINLKDENGNDVIYDVIYNSLLEWLLHKKPASIDSSSMIDEPDKISSVNAILVMIKFYKHASEFVKQKMIQDLYMLVKWNTANRTALLGVPEFQYFLFDLLFGLQLNLMNEELRGVQAAIWELGVKTHTLLTNFALLNLSESHQRLQSMFIWVANKKIQTNKANRIKVIYFVELELI